MKHQTAQQQGAEIKTEIEAFLELDEAIAVQKLSLGAKESDIILPDTLEVRGGSGRT